MLVQEKRINKEIIRVTSITTALVQELVHAVIFQVFFSVFSNITINKVIFYIKSFSVPAQHFTIHYTQLTTFTIHMVNLSV